MRAEPPRFVSQNGRNNASRDTQDDELPRVSDLPNATNRMYYRLHLTANTYEYRGFGKKKSMQNQAKPGKNTFTSTDQYSTVRVLVPTVIYNSSSYVQYKFHYAFSCTRFSAVRFCTNMGQVSGAVFDLFSTCFLRTGSDWVRFGTVVLSKFYHGFASICVDFQSIYHRFSIDCCGNSVRGQMQAVITNPIYRTFIRVALVLYYFNFH